MKNTLIMNCIIPGLNLKVFAKALHALVKVGENVYIEAEKEKFTFVTLNLRKTVCVRYYFLDNFFSCYEVNNNEIVNCKLQMKTLLPLFKGTHLEKKLDFVKIEYENNADWIIFKMKYKCDDIIMTHKLRLMEAETLTVQISPDAGSNNILGSSSTFNQLSSMFSNSDDEITLEISKQKVLARNYYVGAPVRPKTVRSQVNLNGSEFTTYQIDKEATINFSLKLFRTAIQFADSFNLNVGLNFEKGGRPLAIVMKNPAFEVNFIVATLDPYCDDQSSFAGSSIPAKVTQLNNEKINITLEDQNALLNENWDDNFETNNLENTVKSANKLKKNVFDEIMSKAINKNKENVRNNSKVNTVKFKKKFSLGEGGSDDQQVELLPKSPCIQDNIIPSSPESPKTKKAKLVFGRCFESTFSRNNLGEVLAANSDSE